MRNLCVRGRPAETWTGSTGTVLSLPASVQLEYGSSEVRDDLAFVTSTLVLKPAQARALAAELLAAADVAEGKATPAGTVDVSSGGTGGTAPAGDAATSQHTVGAQDNTPPGGAEQGVELPENRGAPSEATACGICGQETR